MEESREGGERGGHSQCSADWDALSRMEAERHTDTLKKKLGEISYKIENVGAADGAFTGLKHLET